MGLDDEVPSVESASEAGVFGLLEMLRHHFSSETLLVRNHEAAAVGMPADHIRMKTLIKD